MRKIWSSLFWEGTQRSLVVIDVSGQPIGPVFKGQAVQGDWSRGEADQKRCLAIDDGTHKTCRNIGKQLPTYAA
jgi:hypothetical protein